jgi:hypothetical protein
MRRSLLVVHFQAIVLFIMGVQIPMQMRNSVNGGGRCQHGGDPATCGFAELPPTSAGISSEVLCEDTIFPKNPGFWQDMKS